jgi:hydroxymethylglutaryl-CoA lyase
MQTLPKSVKIVEVGPRDGLQSQSQVISSEDKINYIDLLSETGLQEIEVTSFVSPKWIPQLADAAEVSRSINRHPEIIYTALVPNFQGLQNAIKCQFRSIAVFTAASESFSQKNTNCSIDDSMTRFQGMRKLWEENNLRVRGYISTVWHCPYEGPINIEPVIDVITKLFELGINEISLGDTIGKANPNEIRHTLDTILNRWDPASFALHFHDTFGMAESNIIAGLEFGINTFDSSAGGIGGCPYAEGASGNIATEKVFSLCDSMGIETGIQKDKLDEAAKFIRSILKKESLIHAED